MLLIDQKVGKDFFQKHLQINHCLDHFFKGKISCKTALNALNHRKTSQPMLEDKGSGHPSSWAFSLKGN